MASRNQTQALLFGFLLSLAFLSACAGPASDLAAPAGSLDPLNDLRRVGWWNGWRVPDFSDDLSLESLVASCQESIDYYAGQPEGRTYRFGRDLYTAEEMRRFLVDFVLFMGKYPDAKQRRRYLKENATVYRGGSRWEKMLFTGYYEPVLEGSRLPGVLYGVPIFGVPSDLIIVDLEAFDPREKGNRLVGRYRPDGILVPYHTRHEIDRLDVISGRGYELAWVRDPLEAFFLHIQGSGKILMPDGSVMNVHYAGNNGRPYRPIGRLLLEQGKIAESDVSAETIQQYMREHPEEMADIMDYNERYVFFEETQGGPYGSTGALLTPDRSMATDPSFYPPGALAYIETEVPGPVTEGEPLRWVAGRRFVLNQDAGGGVRGPCRGDLYFGTGPLAGIRAGEMKKPGKVFFLAPKKKKDREED